MISDETMAYLEKEKIPYILGARMRRVKEIKEEVLSRAGRYREVHPEGVSSKDPSPLKVKEVMVWMAAATSSASTNDRPERMQRIGRRSSNPSGEAQEQSQVSRGKQGLPEVPEAGAGDRGHQSSRRSKKRQRFDGKWVLKTNTTLTAEQAALKYKELWQVEQVFRDMKSVLETRPIFHQRDETIRGHVFCSFLALVLRKELDRRLEKAGHCFEWADIKQDLKALQEITIEDNGKRLAIRSECQGTCGKVFQAVGVAIPPTIREVA